MITVPQPYSPLAEIADLRAAYADLKQHRTLPDGVGFAYTHVLLHDFAIAKPQVVAGQQPIVARALGQNPSKRYTTALAEAKKIHVLYRAEIAEIQKLNIDEVKASFRRSVIQGAGSMAGGSAMPELTPEAQQLSWNDTQRLLHHATINKLGKAQIVHVSTMVNEIFSALQAMCATLEARDLKDCQDFNITPEFTPATRLAQSVLVMFARRTIEVPEMLAASADAPACPQAQNILGDFVAEIAAWG